MTFPTGGTAAAFLAFALVITVGAQALAQTPAQTPVQTPTEATPLSADNEFYALRGPAEAGDAQAQFALANHYFDGRGAAQDYGQAVTWYLYKSALRYYHLAANKGYAQAEYNLGAMYQSGLGVKRDDKQAFEWFRKAADQNHPEAENEVGYSYRCGCGVGRDYAQALNWYRRAADHGNSNAETNLGFMAEKGWGQPQSYDEAFSWYYKAADHGNAGAMDNIGFNFQNGVGVAVDFAKAWSWLYRAALLGSGSAENQIGWMYRHGQGVTQDDAIAVWWYRLADAQGISDADLNLRDVCNDHEQRSDELCDLAVPVHDPALELVQRRTTIKDLRARMDKNVCIRCVKRHSTSLKAGWRSIAATGRRDSTDWVPSSNDAGVTRRIHGRSHDDHHDHSRTSPVLHRTQVHCLHC